MQYASIGCPSVNKQLPSKTCGEKKNKPEDPQEPIGINYGAI
jgi:hypothetical protein